MLSSICFLKSLNWEIQIWIALHTSWSTSPSSWFKPKLVLGFFKVFFHFGLVNQMDSFYFLLVINLSKQYCITSDTSVLQNLNSWPFLFGNLPWTYFSDDLGGVYTRKPVSSLLYIVDIISVYQVLAFSCGKTKKKRYDL